MNKSCVLNNKTMILKDYRWWDFKTRTFEQIEISINDNIVLYVYIEHKKYNDDNFSIEFAFIENNDKKFEYPIYEFYHYKNNKQDKCKSYINTTEEKLSKPKMKFECGEIDLFIEINNKLLESFKKVKFYSDAIGKDVIIYNESYKENKLEFVQNYINENLANEEIEKISDGYHTFNELYDHRMILFSVICNQNKEYAWKSWLHNDGTMFDDYFIVGIKTPEGEYSYHYHKDNWDKFDVKELEKAPAWDGHLPKDITRLLSLIK